MSTARGLGVVTAVLLAVSMIIMSPGTPSVATPAGRPGGPTSSVPSAHRVSIPAAVTHALAAGSASVLVSYDAGPALRRITALTAGRPTRATRSAATRGLSEELGQVKSAAIAAAGSGAQVRREFDHLPVQLVRLDSTAALERLAAAPDVTSLALPRSGEVSSGAALTADQALIGQPAAAAAGSTGAGVRVAVIDTGADWTLPGAVDDFGDCHNGPGSTGCRIDRLVDVAGAGVPDVDPDHHGTQVAAIVAATAPSAHLDVYNVFHATAGGATQFSETDLLTALNQVTTDAANRNVRAVNLSLGLARTYYTGDCSADAGLYSAAFSNLRALGVVPVVSAGNAADVDGTFRPGIGLPACATGAVSVGAVYDHDFDVPLCPGLPAAHHEPDEIACFSQTGDNLSLLAPGVRVTAAGITASGTSQAAPHVAGAVADLAEVGPRASAQQIVRALTTTGPLITDARPAVPINRHRLDIAAAAQAVQAPGPELDDPGCTAQTLPASDDGSSGAVPLGFVADFYGTRYNAVYVNTNGNVTFAEAKAGFSPQPITAASAPIIAPFLADVDTRGSGSGVVGFGRTTFGGRRAFCVDWNDVGYYAQHADKRDSFQLLLVDRSDVGAGDIDMVMNYGTISWESGDASGGKSGVGGSSALVGYSAGDGMSGHAFQLAGSLSPGALLDTNASTGLVNGAHDSDQLGRYVFGIRNGAAPGAAVSPVVLTADPASATAGQPITLTASITGAEPDPGGTVTLSAGGQTLTGCDQVPVTNGAAVCRTVVPDGSSALAVSAFYSGDGRLPPAYGDLDVPLAQPRSAQSIEADQVATVPLTAGTTWLTARGGASGLPITVVSESTDVCQVVATTQSRDEDGRSEVRAQLSLVGVGTCTLRLSQPGNEHWAPADDVHSAFPVEGNPAPSDGVLVDHSVSVDHVGTADDDDPISTPELTTSEDGELLLAFVSADGPVEEAQQVSRLGGGDLDWQRVTHGAPGYGTVEVWQAYAASAGTTVAVAATLSHPGFDASITLSAFRGAGTAVAASTSAVGLTGAPVLRLNTQTTGGRVWLVGHQWSTAMAAVPRANQSLAHSWADDGPGDSFWVQYDQSLTSEQWLTLGARAPNDGPWQLAAVEIPPR